MTPRLDVTPISLLLECSGGGTGRHVMDLFAGLRERGRDVRLIVSLLRADEGFLEALARITPDRVVNLNLHRSPHPSDIQATLRLRGELRRRGAPSLLHAHSTKAGMIANAVRAAAATTVFTPHAYRGMDPTLGGPKKAIIMGAERIISARHERVIAVSQDEAAYARALGLPPKRVVYIPNGVDIVEIAAAAAVAKEGRPTRPDAGPVLGFVGRMTHQKNPVAFLQAFERVRVRFPAVRGLMLGDGPMLADMRAMAAERGLADAVEIAGHARVVERLLEMDIMVHTSHYESLPYSLLEGCAAGLPVISVRNAGSSAIFGEGADLVADPANASAIADQIIRLLDGPDAMASARTSSAEAARRFSLDTMIDATEQLYEAALTP